MEDTQPNQARAERENDMDQGTSTRHDPQTQQETRAERNMDGGGTNEKTEEKITNRNEHEKRRQRGTYAQLNGKEKEQRETETQTETRHKQRNREHRTQGKRAKQEN